MGGVTSFTGLFRTDKFSFPPRSRCTEWAKRKKKKKIKCPLKGYTFPLTVSRHFIELSFIVEHGEICELQRDKFCKSNDSSCCTRRNKITHNKLHIAHQSAVQRMLIRRSICRNNRKLNSLSCSTRWVKLGLTIGMKKSPIGTFDLICQVVQSGSSGRVSQSFARFLCFLAVVRVQRPINVLAGMNFAHGPSLPWDDDADKRSRQSAKIDFLSWREWKLPVFKEAHYFPAKSDRS